MEAGPVEVWLRPSQPNHVRIDVIGTTYYGETVELRSRAESWSCPECSQRNSGWAETCGRCLYESPLEEGVASRWGGNVEIRLTKHRALDVTVWGRPAYRLAQAVNKLVWRYIEWRYPASRPPF